MKLLISFGLVFALVLASVGIYVFDTAPATGLITLAGGSPDTAMRTSLFPAKQHGFVDALDFALAQPEGGRVVWAERSDGGRIDTYMRADQTMAARVEYYPLLPGAPLNALPLLKNGEAFAADGKTKIGDSAFDAAGFRTFWGKLMPNGQYRIRHYFAGGVNIQLEDWFAPDLFATNFEPKLVREDRYREDQSLFSAYVLNDDGTGTTTWLDRQQRVLKVKHQGIRANIATIVAYYPGTTKVRMSSDSTYQGTVANFFRIDGTLSSTMSITTYNVVVRYFDATGEKILYTQLWGLNREAGKTSFDLWRLAEFDKDGTTRRELSFENGRLQEDDRTDVTIGGVDYDAVTLKYRPDGKLDSVQLTPHSGQSSTSDVAAEALRSEVPPQELEADLGEDLPIPPLPVEEHQGGR